MIDRMLPLFALPTLAVLIVLLSTAIPLLNRRQLTPVSLSIGAGILAWALGLILVSTALPEGTSFLLPVGKFAATAGSLMICLTLISAAMLAGRENPGPQIQRILSISLAAGSVLSAFLLAYFGNSAASLSDWVYLAVLLPLVVVALVLQVFTPGLGKNRDRIFLAFMALVVLLAVTTCLLVPAQINAVLGTALVLLAILHTLLIFAAAKAGENLQALLPVPRAEAQALFLVDKNNRIEEASGQAATLLGARPGSLRGKTWQNLEAEHLAPGKAAVLPAADGNIWQIHDRSYQLEIYPVYQPGGEKRRLFHLNEISTEDQQIRLAAGLDRLLQAINELPVLLNGSPSLQDGLQKCLVLLGKTTRAGRVTLMENSLNPTGTRLMSLVTEWCAPGISSRIQDAKQQAIPYSLSRFGAWEKDLSERRTIQHVIAAGEIPADDTLIATNCRSLLLVPVFSGAEWWGVLGVEGYQHPVLQSQTENRLLRAAADHLGAALQLHNWEISLRQRLEAEVKERTNELLLANSRLELELNRRELAEALVEKKAQQLLALHEASNALLVTLDLEPLLGRILDSAMSAIPRAEKGTLHLIAKDTGQLEMRAVLGFSDTRIRRLYGQDKRGVLARAVQEKRPILVSDTRGLDELMPVSEAFETETVRSLIISPMIADQDILGALSLAASSPDSFDENDLQVLTSFATTATLALRNAQLHAAVQKMAITDSLTQIYNRRGFMEIGERLFESARRFRHPLTAIALDLDYFKEVNDKFGHNTGDQALQFFAELMLRSLRKVDLVGRMGGDEFAILLPETDIFHAVQVGERIRKKTELSTFPTGQEPLKLTVSLGIAKLSTQTAQLDELLNRADKALYESKNSGRNRSRMFPLESRMPDFIPPG
jgi:diguanylate cyclase (GGDEF)-like protein